MEQSITIKKCPVCGEEDHKDLLICRDHTATQEDFRIVECMQCGFAFTSPRPADERLGAYYASKDYISHSNTKKGLISGLYQVVRKRTLRGKLGLLNKEAAAKGSILDIGCGTGEFLNVCKTGGWKVIGVEPNEEARKKAIANYELDVREEIYLATAAPGSFDAITLWHVLEHIPRLHERLRQLKSLLKADGVLIIAVPNRSSHDAAYYGKFWAAYDVPRHLWHFRPQDMRKLLDRFGFSVQQVLPMRYDSYYVSMLSEKYKTGGINFLRAVYRGWLSNRKAGMEKWSSQIYVIRHLSTSSGCQG
ncbi:MAG TPA: class I SAM-dependent methyltransferase [Bacteroidia bacterium]|nr:class I SAM-dependent methyltransferase [Bacteroidia bacterium]